MLSSISDSTSATSVHCLSCTKRQRCLERLLQPVLKLQHILVANSVHLTSTRR